jgi:hypothetical protein
MSGCTAVFSYAVLLNAELLLDDFELLLQEEFALQLILQQKTQEL